MVLERVRRMSVGEFLDFAETSEEAYEYLDGELIAMSGGTLNHYRVIRRLLNLLEWQLAGSDCEIFPGGLLVQAGEGRLLAPDLSVVCGPAETDATSRLLLNPLVVVEVTSPSTARVDRVSKLQWYFDAPSIQAYLIVDQHRPFVELYTRAGQDWLLKSFSDMGADVPIAALGCQLSLREIYRGIAFEAPEA